MALVGGADTDKKLLVWFYSLISMLFVPRWRGFSRRIATCFGDKKNDGRVFVLFDVMPLEIYVIKSCNGIGVMKSVDV